MHMDSDDIRVLLWGALGVMVSVSFISQFAPLGVLAVLVVLSSLAYWLLAHPEDLRVRYEIVTARFHRGTRLSQKWAILFWINLSFIFLIGLSFLYFGYLLSTDFHEPRGSLFKFVRVVFGVEGFIVTVTVAGISLVAVVTETVMGSRVRRQDET